MFLSRLSPLLQSSGFRQSFAITFGNICAAGLSAIATILITRKLGPTQFGEFSTGLAFVLLLSKISDFGMTVTLQKFAGRRKDHRYINQLFSVSLKIKLIVIGLLALVALLLVPWLTAAFKLSSPDILYGAVLCLPVIVLYEHFQAMLQSLHQFAQSSFFAITQSAVKVCVAITLYAVVINYVPFIFIFFLLSPLIPLMAFRVYFPEWIRLNVLQSHNTSHHLLKSTLKHAAVGVICIAIIEQIDILFVSYYLSNFETGLLGGISKISLLVTVMAYSVSSVLNPRVSRYKHKADLEKFTKKAFLLSGAILLAFMLVIPFTTLLVKFTIGPDYLQGNDLLAVALAASFLTFAAVPFISTFFAYDAPWFFSISGVVQAVIIIAGNFIFVPIYGLEASVWTRFASQLVLLLLAVGLSLYFLSTKKKTSFW